MFFSGCTEKYKLKIEELKAQIVEERIDSDRRQRFITDSIELELRHTLVQIESEMSQVLTENGILVNAQEGAEFGVDRKTSILNRVQDFKELIAHNRARIDHLLTKLDKTVDQNKDLIASLERTQLRLKEQEARVDQLVSALQAEQVKTASLEHSFLAISAQNDTLKTNLDRLDRDLHKGFYIVGDYRKLKERGVVEKEGGLLKIGATHVLNDDFDEQVFTKLDIREKVLVPLQAKKAALITEHPSDSYEFTTEGDEIAALEIKDPEAFWRASKFMVIETK